MNKQAGNHTAPWAHAQTEREFYTKIWNGPTCLQNLPHKFEYDFYNENLNSQQLLKTQLIGSHGVFNKSYQQTYSGFWRFADRASQYIYLSI